MHPRANLCYTLGLIVCCSVAAVLTGNGAVLGFFVIPVLATLLATAGVLTIRWWLRRRRADRLPRARVHR